MAGMNFVVMYTSRSSELESVGDEVRRPNVAARGDHERAVLDDLADIRHLVGAIPNGTGITTDDRPSVALNGSDRGHSGSVRGVWGCL
jgi:hypothetical protein